MKKLISLSVVFLLFFFSGYGQTEKFNLASQNLHKKVRKTIDHYYSYDKTSGGFVKKSVSIKNYNDDGNLIETFYKYNSVYSESSPTKKRYIYNGKNQLIRTEDISDEKGKYSSHYEYKYDKKGRLIKRTNIYKNGDTSYKNYKRNRRGKLTRIENYNTSGKISEEIDITHKGNKRTEVKTSYSSKDGSIYGVYTTVFKNDVKISYKSESKYGNSTSTYSYDKYDNLKETITINDSKTNRYTNDYVYDKKDNWVKKHNSSNGKYHYFYFREIIFKGGKTTGNTDFDRKFINIHGNFDNVAVVPLKKKIKKKDNNYNNTTVVNNNTNNSAPAFRYKNWKYTYVKMKKEFSNVTGKISVSVEDGNRLKENATVEVKIEIDGSSTRTGKYTVIKYSDSELIHIWVLKNKKNGKLSTISTFKKKRPFKGKDLDAMFMVGKGDDKIIFYLY